MSGVASSSSAFPLGDRRGDVAGSADVDTSTDHEVHLRRRLEQALEGSDGEAAAKSNGVFTSGSDPDPSKGTGSSGLSGSTLHEDPAKRAPEIPRWQRGCMRQYTKKEGCIKKGCPFLHDLTKKEVAMLVSNANQEGHVLFSNSFSDSGQGGSTSSVSSSPGTGEHSMEERRQLQAEQEGERQSTMWVQHSCGNCKPCYFHQTPEGCADGALCRFCHYPHERLSRRIKLRPCKGKRDRYRKLVSRVTKAFEEDPEGFDPSSIEIPQSVSKNEVVKRMFMGKIMQQVEEAKGRLQREGHEIGQTHQASKSYQAAPEQQQPRVRRPNLVSL